MFAFQNTPGLAEEKARSSLTPAMNTTVPTYCITWGSNSFPIFFTILVHAGGEWGPTAYWRWRFQFQLENELRPVDFPRRPRVARR